MQSTLRPRGSGVTAATPDLGFGAFGRGGSTPPSRTQLSPPVQCGSGRTPGTRRALARHRAGKAVAVPVLAVTVEKDCRRAISPRNQQR